MEKHEQTFGLDAEGLENHIDKVRIGDRQVVLEQPLPQAIQECLQSQEQVSAARSC